MADEVPAFDDIPSFDDLPDAAASSQRASSGAVPAFDDIPSFDDLPDGVQPEGKLATAGREAAHGVVPAAAGLVGMGAGALAGAPLGPVGAIAGGIIGGVAASMGTEYVQQKVLEAVDLDDSEQRAANREENKWSAFGGGMIPAVAGMSVSAGASRLAPAANELVQRGAGAAFGGAMEAGGEYVSEGTVDPARVGAAAVIGAVAPGVNRFGQKFVNAGARMVPGRPGRTANPEAAQAHADVDDGVADVDAASSSLAQTPPPATGETTGNPQSAPARSARVYSKGVNAADQGRYAEALSDPEAMRQFAADEGLTVAEAQEIARANYEPPGTMTQGHIAPDQQAALDATNPAPEPSLDTAPDTDGMWRGGDIGPDAEGEMPPNLNARKPTLSLKPRPVEPVVEAGIPQEGEPVAMGANDATPMPPGTPERAAKAIARSKRAPLEMTGTARQNPDGSYSSGDGANSIVFERPAAKPMPELKGETPINDSVTEAQKAAGNYPKARTHDFGKPVKVETHAGDTRRGKAPDGTDWEVKLPYDYGYFNKTKGADKDHIDFARPKADDPALGDKHYIIDQKNAETGKFDEHKVFTYYADEAAARQHYAEGFSDGKGGQRLGAITEVTRPELVKFLAKHTSRASNKPFGKMDEATLLPGAKKPVKERAVVQDLVQKLEAAGKGDEAKKLLALPDDQVAKAIEGKRVRKYGVGTGTSAGYPVEGVFTSDGKPVTANTKAKAAERTNAHKGVVNWFEKSKPAGAPDAEPNGALLDRLKQAAPNIEGWKPTHKPKEWMLAREAQRVLMKPTPGNIKKYREAERLLRGDDAAVESYRSGNRIDADIAQSRRSGDEAVAAAENKNVNLGVNAEEDALIAAIDAKKAKKGDYWDELAERTFDRTGVPKKDRPKFDVPHEEAEAMVTPTPVKSKADLKQLPSKTVDAKDSSLAKIDTKAISKDVMAAADKRKAEAAALAGRKSAKAAGTESEGAAAPARQIPLHDPVEMKRLIDAVNAAQKKADPSLDILPADAEPTPKMAKGAKDLFDHFIADERGSLDLNKIKQSWLNAMVRTPPKSYRSMPLKTKHDEYIQSVSDDLHKIANNDKNQWNRLLKKLQALPKELNNEATLAEIYHARDMDSAHFPLPAGQTGTHVDNLPPAAKALYDKHLKPLFDANDTFVKAIREIDPERIGPDVMSHISRITHGDTAGFDILRSTNDPTQPTPQYSGLSVNANAAKTRKFYALVGADGRRHVVQPTDNGFVKWDKYKRENIKDPTFEFEDGKAYKAGPNDYVMRQATTKEIMDNARGADRKPMKYYTNAAFSVAVGNAQLGSMMRHLRELNRLTDTPAFRNLSSKNPASKADKGYDETTLPNMRGRFLHPDLKAVFDDFAGNPQNGYRQLNSQITKLLFWMPVPHINNQGTHWFVGRGWDNLSIPKNYKLLMEHFPNAVREVSSQGPYVRAMMREGAGLIYPSVVTRDMLGKIAKNVGLEMERQPDLWDKIAGKLGVPLRKLHTAIYDNFSAPMMWSSSDVFLVMRVMELEAKGMKMKDAIVEAERDIPNYRLPHTVISNGPWGRTIAKTVGDPAKVAFGRYHYGMINSYANIVRDALGSKSTLGDRVDAAGKLMAMGLLGMLIYPYLYDKLAKAVTGNEEAKAGRRGPTTVPHHLAQAAEGKQDPMSALRGVATVPPLLSGTLQLFSNKDFRGKSIIEPGDFRAAVHGDPKAAARTAAQLGEHTARVAVSPYNTLAGAIQKENSQPGASDRHPGARAAIAAGKAVRDMALDIKDPSAKSIHWARKSPILNEREARSRFKHGGSGPIEGLVNKGTGYR